MKNTTLFFGIVIILAVAGVLFYLSSEGVSITSNVIGKGEVQKIVISYKNYNYYPQEIRVKEGQPVSISLDNSVGGCFRSFTIRGLGLAKYLATPQDTLEFTPTQKGTYRFACSMGMGTGTLIVE